MRIKSLLRYSAVKYGLVGVLGTLLHFALLIFLVEWGGFPPVAGSGIGFVAVLLVSYFLNRKWTFQNAILSGKPMIQFIKYCVVSCSGLLLNSVVMYACVDLAALPYLVGQAFITVLVPVHNYLLNLYWTFKKTPSTTSAQR